MKTDAPTPGNTSTKPNFGFPSSWFSSSNPNSPSTQNIGFLPQFVNNQQPGAEQENGVNQSTFVRLLSDLRQRLRPWSEFSKSTKFGWPPSAVALLPRIKHNLQYFMTNYMCLIVVLFIYCILTSFLMLLALVVLFGLFYTIYQRSSKGPIILGGYEVPPSLMYTVALMACFPLFAMADAGEVMYWVIGTSMFLALAHATFYCSEEVPGAEFEVVTVVQT